MMKRFSTRADKWLYIFALISHIFNFLAESQILFLYYIVDHQKDHFFCWFYRSNQFSNNLLFLFVHLYHLFSPFLFVLFFFSFFFQFFSSFSSSFSLVDRLSLVFRRLSWSVRFLKNQRIFFFFFFLFFFLFQCFELLRQSSTSMMCLKTSIFAKM